MADAAADTVEVCLKIVKAASKEGTKYGATKMGLADDVAQFLAEQLAVTFRPSQGR